MADLHKRKGDWTSGITVQIPDHKEFRYFLFEIDRNHLSYFYLVENILQYFKLDYLYHRTGSGGYHFISPTVIDKQKWKSIHKELNHINSICPMTTLRILPNKYSNESEFWYRHKVKTFKENFIFNSKDMCYYLNKIFGSDLDGYYEYPIRTVRYKLP